jgi:hypothetical protein
VHALRRIHATLLPSGLVVDSQPVSPDSWVEAADGGLGSLDMREWRATIDAVDERTVEAIDSGCSPWSASTRSPCRMSSTAATSSSR